jgi:microcystin-dependent protein
LPAHNHAGLNGGSVAQIAGDNDDGIFVHLTSGQSTTTGSNSAVDAAQAHPNMQPFLALNYIVKY